MIDPENIKNVTVDSMIRGGTPVITGTRIPVAMFLSSLADNMRLADFAEDMNLKQETLVDLLRSLERQFQ